MNAEARMLAIFHQPAGWRHVGHEIRGGQPALSLVLRPSVPARIEIYRDEGVAQPAVMPMSARSQDSPSAGAG